MEGGFNFPFGGDPEDLMRGLREFAERQAESVQEAQREQFATLTLNTAVELTAAGLKRLDGIGMAARRLERALDPAVPSPFAESMQAAVGAVEELTADVERNHKVPLT